MYNILNYYVPLSSSSSVVELSVDSLTSDFPLLAMDRAEKLKRKINKLIIFFFSCNYSYLLSTCVVLHYFKMYTFTNMMMNSNSKQIKKSCQIQLKKLIF